MKKTVKFEKAIDHLAATLKWEFRKVHGRVNDSLIFGYAEYTCVAFIEAIEKGGMTPHHIAHGWLTKVIEFYRTRWGDALTDNLLESVMRWRETVRVEGAKKAEERQPSRRGLERLRSSPPRPTQRRRSSPSRRRRPA